jgi:hypothetical protein
MPIRSRGAGVIAQTPGTWVPLWDLDCTAQDDHDLLTEGAYADTTGVTTWDITDDTILGNANASVLGFQNGTGLVITTSADGEISVAQEIATLYPGIGREDRVALVVDLDSSAFVANNQYVKWAIGTRTWGTSTLTVLDGFGGGAVYHGVYLRDGGGASVGGSIGAAVYDSLGLDFSDQQARGYGKSSFAAPWTGWTALRRAGWNSQPNTADDSRPTAADAWFQLALNRNAGPNLTLTVRRMAVYGWVPLFR